MNLNSGNDTLKVKFTHSNTVRDKKPYTIYEIEVLSTTANKWVIYKRYSDFYTLHQELSKHHTARSHIRLPHLPPKRLTRSLAAEFVEKRKNELQAYQREILAIKELLHSQVLLKFLEVPESERGLIAVPSQSLGVPDTKDWFARQKMNPHQSYEERKVFELINLLELHPNRVSAIKSFEDYFFGNRPRLAPEYIRQLFLGKLGGSGEGGLVQTCGDFSYSYVASKAALYLLCRLLDVEKNKDAKLFLDQFFNLSTSVLTNMQLHLHILSERGNRLGAFQIVSLLSRNSPKGQIIEEIVTDTWARQEYNRWAERKIQNVARPTESKDAVLRSLTLKDGHKNIAKQIFEDLLKIAKDKNDHEWRVVTPLSQKMADTEGLRITYKKDAFKDMIILKMTAIIPFSADQVSKFLMIFDLQKEWDPKFHEGKVVAKLNSHTDVVHMVFKSFSSPYKYRDFSLLRSCTKLKNGDCVLGARSILHPQVPKSQHIRALLAPTGYVITPILHRDAQKSVDRLNQERKAGSTSSLSINLPRGSSDSGGLSVPKQYPSSKQQGISLPLARKYCQFTFIAQMDKESVLIVSPDILGETNELADSIANMKSSLAVKYPKSGPPPKVSLDATILKRRATESTWRKNAPRNAPLRQSTAPLRQSTASSPRPPRPGVAPPHRPITPRKSRAGI